MKLTFFLRVKKDEDNSPSGAEECKVSKEGINKFPSGNFKQRFTFFNILLSKVYDKETSCKRVKLRWKKLLAPGTGVPTHGLEYCAVGLAGDQY